MLSSPQFSPSLRAELLHRARTILNTKIAGNSSCDLPSPSKSLHEPCGAFVTLRVRSTRSLRGCIGRMHSQTPLWKTVEELVLQSAREDPRFSPVSPEEVDTLSIEISLLSPLVPVDSPKSILIGTHGFQIEQNGRHAVFLPQVPIDMGWDRDEALRQACHKAGLAEAAVHSSDTRIWIFQSLSFGESDPHA